jgi:RimJ/RimL family protein N-acetyltransferase
MLEFAYTFTPFRGLGIMGDAMRRLLQVAADDGHRSAITYVRDDNIPSLRGCQKVGFDLDHVRATSHRAGITRHAFDPPTEDDRRRWAEATAARPKA